MEFSAQYSKDGCQGLERGPRSNNKLFLCAIAIMNKSKMSIFTLGMELHTLPRGKTIEGKACRIH